MNKTIWGILQEFEIYLKFVIYLKLFYKYLGSHLSLRGCFVFKTNGMVSSTRWYKDIFPNIKSHFLWDRAAGQSHKFSSFCRTKEKQRDTLDSAKHLTIPKINQIMSDIRQAQRHADLGKKFPLL